VEGTGDVMSEDLDLIRQQLLAQRAEYRKALERMAAKSAALEARLASVGDASGAPPHPPESQPPNPPQEKSEPFRIAVDHTFVGTTIPVSVRGGVWSYMRDGERYEAYIGGGDPHTWVDISLSEAFAHGMGSGTATAWPVYAVLDTEENSIQIRVLHSYVDEITPTFEAPGDRYVWEMLGVLEGDVSSVLSNAGIPFNYRLGNLGLTVVESTHNFKVSHRPPAESGGTGKVRVYGGVFQQFKVGLYEGDFLYRWPLADDESATYLYPTWRDGYVDLYRESGDKYVVARKIEDEDALYVHMSDSAPGDGDVKDYAVVLATVSWDGDADDPVEVNQCKMGDLITESEKCVRSDLGSIEAVDLYGDGQLYWQSRGFKEGDLTAFYEGTDSFMARRQDGDDPPYVIYVNLSSLLGLDEKSLNTNEDGKAQLYEFHAGDSEEFVTGSLDIVVRRDGYVRYVTWDSLKTTVPVDYHSIDYNSSGEVQLFQWDWLENSTDIPVTAPTLHSAIPCKLYNTGTGGFEDDLAYVTVGKLVTAGLEAGLDEKSLNTNGDGKAQLHEWDGLKNSTDIPVTAPTLYSAIPCKLYDMGTGGFEDDLAYVTVGKLVTAGIPPASAVADPDAYAAAWIADPPTQTEVQDIADVLQSTRDQLAALLESLRTGGFLAT
jgi:hypothetical protein